MPVIDLGRWYNAAFITVTERELLLPRSLTKRLVNHARPSDVTGRQIKRAYVDKGYVGHDAPKPLRVFRSGQKRGVHGQIRRELRRRSAIEAVIGHCKTDGHLGRNFLKGRRGDHINAVMSAVGYNLRLILEWLRKLLRKIIAAIWVMITPISTLEPASIRGGAEHYATDPNGLVVCEAPLRSLCVV